MPERLQKLLAHAGIASRRAAEAMIAEGRVKLNGVVVTQPGTMADFDVDRITVDGSALGGPPKRHTYILLNKPLGVVSTANDPQGRQTVLNLVDLPERLYPVGRLDTDSEGLMMLTDDGELTYRLTHAKFGVEKEYHAFVRGEVVEADLRQMRRGVELEDGTAKAVAARVLDTNDRGTWVQVILVEGRKRQVRRMLDALGYYVVRLLRVRFGPIRLGELPPGRWGYMTEREVAVLKNVAGLVK